MISCLSGIAYAVAAASTTTGTQSAFPDVARLSVCT